MCHHHDKALSYQLKFKLFNATISNTSASQEETMAAFGPDAAVTVVLNTLAERHGDDFCHPRGRCPVMATLPCMAKLAGEVIDVDKLAAATLAAEQLSACPTWKDIACFMGHHLKTSLPNEADSFAHSGALGHAQIFYCPFDDSDPDGYL